MPDIRSVLRLLRQPVIGTAVLAACSAAFAQGGPAAPVPAMANPAPAPDMQRQLRRGIFLVASPNLNDPNFAQTVVLLIGYGDAGAIGIVINRPTGMPVSTLLPKFKQLAAIDAKILIGGPVGLNTVRLLVHNGPAVQGSLEVFPGAYLVETQRLLKKLLASRAKDTQLRFYAGYAGWGPGQLEAEVRHGDWYLWAADAETVFEKPAARIWPDLVRDAQGQWVYGAPEGGKAVTFRPARTSMRPGPDASMPWKESCVRRDRAESIGRRQQHIVQGAIERGACVKQFTFHPSSPAASSAFFYNHS